MPDYLGGSYGHEKADPIRPADPFRNADSPTSAQGRGRDCRCGGSTATYIYDASGRRVQKIVGSTATSFVYDLAGRVIADYQTP
ncbi:MAG: hypothetical protein WBD87_00230, partial [Candidatus Acidiferrales bacterium]